MGIKDEQPRDRSIVRTGAEMARLAQTDRELAEHLVDQARSEGVNLVEENGLAKGLVKLVLEGALEAEMTEHLGYEKGDPAGAGRVIRATARPPTGGRGLNAGPAQALSAEVGPAGTLASAPAGNGAREPDVGHARPAPD